VSAIAPAETVRPRWTWSDALGGVVMIAAVYSPTMIYTFAFDDRSSWPTKILFAGWDVSVLLVLALVAPIVGKPRRDVLWVIVPYWGWTVAWRFGAGLARAAQVASAQGEP
jgi:hypothetical protein